MIAVLIVFIVVTMLAIPLIKKESWQKGFRSGFEKGLSHRLAELQEVKHEEKSSDS